jgi:hypothetical protein
MDALDLKVSSSEDLFEVLNHIEQSAETGHFEQAVAQLHEYDVAVRRMAVNMEQNDEPRWRALIARQQLTVKNLLRLRDAASSSLQDLAAAKKGMAAYHSVGS